LLDGKGADFEYREYRTNPLSVDELKTLFKKLDVPVKSLLRKRDKAFKELALSGTESDEVLLRHMAGHPTLLQRPIGILGDKAVVGRPIENLLQLLD
jgi:arsenate reductase (glutaredoxin)